MTTISSSTTSTNAYKITTDTTGALVFQTGAGPTTAFTIDSAQNAGLGTTPSTSWQSGRKVFQIGTALALDCNNPAQAIISANRVYTGTQDLYINTAPASVYQQLNGAHTWFSAGSGTAGTAITFTQSLAVGLGTSLALQGATSQTGTGVSFPATQNPSSDVNTLDDYEEGTWTPVLIFGGAAGVTTYNAQNGTYTKVGNMVTVRCYIAIGTKSAATGAANLTGLPFLTQSTTYLYQSATIYVSSGSFTGAPSCYIPFNNTVVVLGQANGSTGFVPITNSNFVNGGDFIFQTSYLAA